MTSGVRNRNNKKDGASTSSNSTQKRSKKRAKNEESLSSGVREIVEPRVENVHQDEETIPRRNSTRGERRSGDGESIPDTPPNEEAEEDGEDDEISRIKSRAREAAAKNRSMKKAAEVVTAPARKPKESPFVLRISVDGMVLLLLLAGLWTRLSGLDQPRNVVFDEMHYGKYASLYLRGTFFFDSNPPLGKMMAAGAAWLAGSDGTPGDSSQALGEDGLSFYDRIGTPYPEWVPVFAMRLPSALCGAALPPAAYLLMAELGASPWAGAMAGALITMDTSLLTQSRFVLLESPLLLLSLLSVLASLRLRRHRRDPFSLKWLFWLCSASALMGLALCVKYAALYTIYLCFALMAQDFWRHRLRDRSLSALRLCAEAGAQCLAVAAIPVAVYLSVFHLHLSLLTRAGVHDSLMTSAFQASLEGGLGSIVRGQPAEVAHGSQVTLRHTHGKTCWLHSHEHVYPVRYEDGRGSSHQQQVSCYGYKDVNNWWIVKRPEREDLAVHEPLDVIRDGETVQLVHGMTHRREN